MRRVSNITRWMQLINGVLGRPDSWNNLEECLTIRRDRTKVTSNWQLRVEITLHWTRKALTRTRFY